MAGLSTPAAAQARAPGGADDPVAQVTAQLRALSLAHDRLDQHAAQRLGLNRTDQRALDLIDRAGALSPTALAAGLGMSTGTTSTVLDRLEAAGYVRREPDPRHRRRTLVRMTGHAESVCAQIFDPVIAGTARHAGGVPAPTLVAIAEFLAGHTALIHAHLDATGEADPPAGGDGGAERRHGHPTAPAVPSAPPNTARQAR